MSISVGICGTGAFAQNFIPLFKAHPLVDRVVLCDLNAEKLANRATSSPENAGITMHIVDITISVRNVGFIIHPCYSCLLRCAVLM